MSYLITAFLCSLLLCAFFIRLSKGKCPFILDTTRGAQKFHEGNVPRIGGLAIYSALLAAGFFSLIEGTPFARKYLFLMFAAFPVFAGGLLEDITKKIGARLRLLFALISALLVISLLGWRVTGVDLPFVDWLFRFYIFSFLFTAFALVGISNALNIIDGFNGLTSGVAMLIFASYAYISYLQSDRFLLYLSLAVVAGILGFFLWNYPRGCIFLGDGGAYFLGFLSGAVGIFLVKKHPQVSPWFVCLVLLYPVWETVFSMYRRKLRGRNSTEPDRLHLHSLVHKRLIRWTFEDKGILNSNAMTSPYLWILQLSCTIPALLFWNNTPLLITSSLFFVIAYAHLYRRIVRFKGVPFPLRLLPLSPKLKARRERK